MSQSLSKLIFETQKLLSNKIGVEYPFYKRTACLEAQFREYIAYCEIIKLFNPSNKRLIKFIDDKLIPTLEYLGMARWQRTEVTDLGFKVSSQATSISLKYLEKGGEPENAESNSS